MPSGSTKQLGRQPFAAQLATLERLQANQPNLHMRVPSVMDAITYWQTLRASQGAVSGNGTFVNTNIRHFNLTPRRRGSFLDAPGSDVDDDGKPNLNVSYAELDIVARVLVG